MKDFNIAHDTEPWVVKFCSVCASNTWHQWNEKQPPHDLYTCKRCDTVRKQTL